MAEKVTEKRNHQASKYRSVYKYQGHRRKSTPKTRATASAPAAARPSNSDADNSCKFDTALEYASASLKNIGLFKAAEKVREVDTCVIADIKALNFLVSGAVCPTCRRSEVRVREPADKRKGLASYLELRCEIPAFPVSVFSATYTSRRVASDGNASTSAGNRPSASTAYNRGSSRECFAIHVKALW